MSSPIVRRIIQSLAALFPLLAMPACASGQAPVDLMQVVERVGAYGTWAPDGRRVAFQSPSGDGRIDLFVHDLESGTSTQLTSDAGRNVHPAWSPTGDHLAFVSDRTGDRDVFVLHLTDGTLTNVTNNPAMDIHPFWSPDGERLLFNSSRADTTGQGNIGEIYAVSRTGGEPERLTHAEAVSSYASWSPTDGRIVFRRMIDVDLAARRGNPEIFVMDARRPEEAVRITTHPADDGYPSWSPDGEHIVFASNRGGSFHVLEVLADGTRQRTLLSDSERLTTPVWSPDGSRLLLTRTVDGVSHLYLWQPR